MLRGVGVLRVRNIIVIVIMLLAIGGSITMKMVIKMIMGRKM